MNNCKGLCAIVVTYNRKKSLLECLDGIRKQSFSVDAILVIDNASEDDTYDLLVSEGYIDECSDKRKDVKLEQYDELLSLCTDTDNYWIITDVKGMLFIYVRMHENTGGAGGFYEGIKIAYHLRYKWVWLMDDDGYPDRDCLRLLMKVSERKSLKVLNSLVIDKNYPQKLSFGLSKKIQTVSDVHANLHLDGLIYGMANPFNGTLIHSEVIKKIGFVKKEMFIWGDETEYFKRIAANDIVYATVPASRFYHPQSKTIYKQMLWGLFKVAVKPEKLEMNYYRNQGYLNRTYNSLLSHRVLLKNMIYACLEGNFSKSIWILKYYIDGFLDDFKLPNIR